MSYYEIPSIDDPLALFEYSVQMVMKLGLMEESNTHQVWANHIFKAEKKAYVRDDLMRTVKHTFPEFGMRIKYLTNLNFC